MNVDLENTVSDSMEMNPALLPYLSYLLQDLWSLGSCPDLIIPIFAGLDLECDKITILDLGCGKGAVCIQLAEKYGVHTIGIDAYQPFLEEAVAKAKEYQVCQLCQFEKQDIKEFTKKDHKFDAVIYASLGGLLGSIRETVGALRRQVINNGYIIIDDGYLKHVGRLEREGYEHYKNHDETLKELTFWGDEVVIERSTTEKSELINREYQQVIEKRGSKLMESMPVIKPLIEEYISRQAEECQIISQYLEGAIWVIRKNAKTVKKIQVDFYSMIK